MKPKVPVVFGKPLNIGSWPHGPSRCFPLIDPVGDVVLVLSVDWWSQGMNIIVRRLWTRDQEVAQLVAGESVEHAVDSCVYCFGYTIDWSVIP